jgi:hypothetical protein
MTYLLLGQHQPAIMRADTTESAKISAVNL